jgi:hypothetical protein
LTTPNGPCPSSLVFSFSGVSMSNDIFDYSVPVFLRGHGILAELLKKTSVKIETYLLSKVVITGPRTLLAESK